MEWNNEWKNVIFSKFRILPVIKSSADFSEEIPQKTGYCSNTTPVSRQIKYTYQKDIIGYYNSQLAHLTWIQSKTSVQYWQQSYMSIIKNTILSKNYNLRDTGIRFQFLIVLNQIIEDILTKFGSRSSITEFTITENNGDPLLFQKFACILYYYIENKLNSSKVLRLKQIHFEYLVVLD